VDGPIFDPLILQLAAGDERAFAVLYDRFAVRMYRTALRLLGSREDAEDVVQDVFMSTVRSREKLGEVRDLAAYLFVSLHRAAGRSAKRRPRTIYSSIAAEEAIAPAEACESDHADWQRLQQAIQLLPDEQREVVIMRVDGELTFDQIAQVMNVSISTAASRYQYALRKLKNSLVEVNTSAGRRR
jgi:RNA polymerase sigma-70 factor, ECF subfamily